MSLRISQQFNPSTAILALKLSGMVHDSPEVIDLNVSPSLSVFVRSE